MEGAVFWLIVAASSSPFVPGKIGPMTLEQCHRMQATLGPPAECRKVVGMRTCYDALPGGPTGYACPLFEGDIPAPVGKQ